MCEILGSWELSKEVLIFRFSLLFDRLCVIPMNTNIDYFNMVVSLYLSKCLSETLGEKEHGGIRLDQRA